MFEEDPGLLPRDILVMMPDVETYAPYIQGVFDTPQGRCPQNSFQHRGPEHGERREGSVKRSSIFLDLQGSRFGVSQVVNLLECEAVRRKFGFFQRRSGNGAQMDF